MCVVSMIMDGRYDDWYRRYYPPYTPYEPPFIQPTFPPVQPFPTQLELDEFKRLLERAREYDKKNNEPNCEMEEKKQKLKKLAKDLGVDISFVDDKGKI
jgi:hypothetical protein